MSAALFTQEQGDFIIARWEAGAKVKTILAEMAERGWVYDPNQVHCWLYQQRKRRNIEGRLAISRRIAVELRDRGHKPAEIAATLNRSVDWAWKTLRAVRIAEADRA